MRWDLARTVALAVPRVAAGLARDWRELRACRAQIERDLRDERARAQVTIFRGRR